MTATFGKLEREKLTLEPGLNVIHAPNEWGKSTWCAFLAAMLYGLDTRSKSTRTALADKERYAPWSGSLMEGCMDINWNGKDITIERTTKGRVPMGQFRAYETASGLEVKELTAANCGSLLLGVERSVFLRSGFIRLNQLPVTEDEALRRRLNALVTTGDESGTAERLAKALREQKNRIRYHKAGLLPAAEAEYQELERKLRELEMGQIQMDQTAEQLARLEEKQRALENHRAALRYQAALEGKRHLDDALRMLTDTESKLAEMEAACRSLPSREEAVRMLEQLDRLRTRENQLQAEREQLIMPEGEGHGPECFTGMDGTEAAAQARQDGNNYRKWKKRGSLLWILGLAVALCGGVAAVWYLLPGLICAGVGLAMVIAGLVFRIICGRKCRKLERKHGTANIYQWTDMAEEYAVRLRDERRMAEAYAKRKNSLELSYRDLRAHIRRITNGVPLENCRREWERVVSCWDRRNTAQREWQQAKRHYESLHAVVRETRAPEYPDDLDCSDGETQWLLSECAAQRRALENRLGQFQGKLEALGDRNALSRQLQQAEKRIRKLEEAYQALSIAQETLAEATEELQRRFAPKIAKRTQELMGRMTGGRYTRLNLGSDLKLHAGAEQENTLREALWRSDGTVDQLYLALRLAVSEALSPDAPLILDDALVRFDDRRLRSAMEILKEEACQKQVILFTCQKRELDIM